VVTEDGTSQATGDLAVTDPDAGVSPIWSLTGGASGAEAPSGEARVVLAGAANAGKSTLFNALLGRERAVVSETRGTTRDAIEELLALSPRDPSVVLVDIAGLDEALASISEIDGASQRLARACVDRADVVILCDPSGVFDPMGLALEDKAVLRVRTKGDLFGCDAGDLSVCALDGFNIESLKRAIADAVTNTGSRCAEAMVLLPRHARALADSRAWISDALTHLEAGVGDQIGEAELVAGALRAALDELSELSGEITPDDVLGRIFSSFCIGK